LGFCTTEKIKEQATSMGDARNRIRLLDWKPERGKKSFERCM